MWMLALGDEAIHTVSGSLSIRFCGRNWGKFPNVEEAEMVMPDGPINASRAAPGLGVACPVMDSDTRRGVLNCRDRTGSGGLRRRSSKSAGVAANEKAKFFAVVPMDSWGGFRNNWTCTPGIDMLRMPAPVV